jgi:hypothetical protein
MTLEELRDACARQMAEGRSHIYLQIPGIPSRRTGFSRRLTPSGGPLGEIVSSQAEFDNCVFDCVAVHAWCVRRVG